jgi:putative ABC transport system permease protein
MNCSVSGFTTWVRPTATRPQVPLEELMERLRAFPGVEAVGAGSRFLRRENRPPAQPIAIFGRMAQKPEEQPTADFKGVSPDWLRALGGRLLRGRGFTGADTLQAPGVVQINETLARRYFPNEDPIGQHLKMDSGGAPLNATDPYGLSIWSEIIGVVSDVKSLHPQPEAVPEVYRPSWQWPMQSPTVLVRAAGDPATLTAAIRREVKAVIPQLPAPIIRTMDDILGETVAQPRFQTWLLSLFGIVALALAAGGLYGVLAYAVSQRQREIGIRMALGAQKRDILSLVIHQGMKLALAGVGMGLLTSLALTRVLRNLLYGVEPADPLTFAAMSLLLVAIALLACWLPVRSATRVDPMEALRYE